MMNAMSAGMDRVPNQNGVNSTPHPRALDRTAISRGLMSRHARIREIEANIDLACESAAVGHGMQRRARRREEWDDRTWQRYVAEAVHQARLCSPELSALRQQASHLERLVGTLCTKGCENATGSTTECGGERGKVMLR